MFINKIDKFLDSQFNIVKTYLTKNKYKKKIKDSGYFLDYYQAIINSISYTNLFKNIKNDKNKTKVRNIIEKYILFYLLLSLAITEDNLIDDDEKAFVEKLFNISNNLPIIDSVVVGDLLDIYQSYYICITLLKILPNVSKDSKNIEVLNIFNDIGLDNVKKFFDLKNNGLHNILITLLIRKIYIKTDKLDISRINEENELDDADYKYIDIVEARIQELDFASMEMLFDADNRRIGLPEDYYNLIQDYNLISLGDIEDNLNPEFAIQSNLICNDRKISYLFHKKLLIPITDEILRYHVNDEKYITQETPTKERSNSKNFDTKLNYIINKINSVTEDPRNPKTKKAYYHPYFYRQAVPYNDIEEMKILKKFTDIGRVNAENVTSFTDLLSFRMYNYINYNKFAHFGFYHKHNYTTDALRYSNFRFRKNETIKKKNSNMDWRIITHDNFRINNQHDFNSAIVGVAFPTYINFMPYDIRCLKINKAINVRRFNSNGYKIAENLLSKLINENKKFNKTPFWIFDATTDKFIQDTYEDINNANQEIFFKKLTAKLYDTIEELTLHRILSEYEKYSPLTLYQSNQIFKIITKRLVPIPQFSNKIADINYARYFTYLPQRLNTDDIKDFTFSTKKLLSLPVYQKPNLLAVTVIDINKNIKTKENILDVATCQHVITLNEIKKYRERDPTLFSKKLIEFFKQYVVDKVNSNYICISCSEFIDIDKYISEYGDLIKVNAESRVPLEEQKRYEKFAKAIHSLDKIIERMGSIFNLSEYISNNPTAIIKRRETIRQLLDILLSSQDLRSKDSSNFDSTIKLLEEISGAKYSEYFAFPVENDIFVYSSRDTDKYKKAKYNTILTHIACLMILDISSASIIYFNTDKLININIFDKFGLGTLDNLKLRINLGNDLVHLGNYYLLSYVIYYMASMMIRYRIYEIENSEIDVKKSIPPLDRLRIMHTMVHVLSIIINRRINTTDYLYEILANNYFIKLMTVFNPETSTNSVENIKYFGQKKLENTIGKKLNTVKQYYHQINGELQSIKQYNYGFIPINFKFRYFPNKIINDNFVINKNEMDELVKNNLLKMYKRETSLLKLNIDINKLENYTLSQVLEIRYKYINQTIETIDKQRKDLLKFKQKQIKLENKFIKLYEYLNENLVPFDKLITLFIDKIEKYVGNDNSIFKEDFYLRKSIFIIDHDVNGSLIKPIKIDKITIKYNDTVTKKDVIIYREKTFERYYNIYNLAYLGYKESSGNFIEIKNSKFLIIKHSLLDKIKYIGLYNKYVNILPIEKQVIYKFKFRGDMMYDDMELINNIIVNKINQDKILIEKFQRIIFSIRNKKEIDPKKFGITKEELLINEFLPRLSNLKVLNNEFVLFLQNWKNVCFGFTVKPLDKINIKDDFIDSDTIISNNNYNVLIRYLIMQLIDLLEMNTDKTNINLASLIAMIFDNIWEEYEIKNNSEINKFLLLLYTGVEDYNITLSGVDSVATVTEQPMSADELSKLTDEEREKIKNELEDDKEREDAIDAEPTDAEDLDLGEQEIHMDDREVS